MEFYAVTETSLYWVTDTWDEMSGFPIVEKVAIKQGATSSVPVGARLKRGQLIGISNESLALYDEDHPKPGRRQPPDTVNYTYWGGGTTPLRALLIDKSEALECLNDDSEEKAEFWKERTKKVVDMIGNDHPTFVFATTFIP